MLQEFLDLIESKSPGAQSLLIVKRGSQAYGTAIPTSDIDYAGVYIQHIDNILGYGYKEQINDDKNDTVFYEIKRFLDLVATNNPTILELLNTPEDCILYKHPYQKYFSTETNSSLKSALIHLLDMLFNKLRRQKDRTRNKTGRKTK